MPLYRTSTETSARGKIAIDAEYENVKLNDLDLLATLGVGGFGRVELVTMPFIPCRCSGRFASLASPPKHWQTLASPQKRHKYRLFFLGAIL